MRITKCKHSISAWSKEFHTNSKEFHTNNKKLILELKDSLDTALTAHILNDELIYVLNLKLLKAYKDEEEFWRQRSRLMWLTLGDKNTSLFHAVTKGRRAQNKILVIERADGTPVFEDDKIAAAIGAYFQDIFTSSGNSALEIVIKAIKPFISTDTNEKLIQPPSPGEIKEALFAIHPDKARGFAIPIYHTCMARCRVSISQCMATYVWPGFKGRK